MPEDTARATRESATARRQAATRQRTLLQEMWHKRRCYLYLVPIFALLGIFCYYPNFSAFYYSMFDYNIVTSRFVGFKNFILILKNDTFRICVTNVLKIILASLAIGLIPTYFAAELLFALRDMRTTNLYRNLFLLPSLVPGLVVVTTWRYIFDPRYGLINAFLKAVGLGFLQHDWLGSFDTALPSILFIGFPWIGGTTLLIFLAGLLNIPTEIYDAYKLDAGWGLRRIWHIDIPLTMGVIKLNLVMSTIGALQGLGAQFLLTQGGPGNATNVPAFLLFTSAFGDQRFGYASAIGVLLFLAIFTLTLINMRFLKSSAEYEPGR